MCLWGGEELCFRGTKISIAQVWLENGDQIHLQFRKKKLLSFNFDFSSIFLESSDKNYVYIYIL